MTGGMLARSTVGETNRATVRCEEFSGPEEVPDNSLVRIRGPDGETLPGYRGVRRGDTGAIVSVVSTRYGLVSHREVARAVDRVRAALDPAEAGELGRFPRRSIRLYSGGRRMEVKLVAARSFPLGDGEVFYPGLRVLNSLDGSWAIRLSGFAVRIACENQLYAERGNIAEWRELHLDSGTDLVAHLERAFYEFLGEFPAVLELYRRAISSSLLAAEVAPRLERHGMPARHAQIIGGRVEAEASHVAILSRWAAYQVASAYLTREVHVNPDRERRFERLAAQAILFPPPGDPSSPIPSMS